MSVIPGHEQNFVSEFFSALYGMHCNHALFVFSQEPARGPNITNITPSSNTLQVTWEKLSVDYANGDITIYEVCYQLGSTDPDCTMSKNVTGVNNTTDLTGLKPATMYTVAVRAFTIIGGGPSGESKSAKTNESGEFYFVMYSVA
jgi:hypothetical protein